MVHAMFRGVYTAIVTPFNQDGSVDLERFKALIELQHQAGIAGIVPVGTTGESPTVSVEEHCALIDAAVEACRGRMKVIAGAGANSTSEALALTRHAIEAGADATLQVTPYYNKPNQEGLFRHFSAVADLELPVVLYNVPGRTGREIAVDTVIRLAQHPSIVAIKEAGGSVERVSAICSQCDLTVLSGDDSLTLPMIAVGAVGVISVASNVAPAPLVNMVRAALEGRWDEARRLHLQYYALFTDLFIDANPIPAKADTLIDFSFHAAVPANMVLAAKLGKPVVLGITGLNAEEEAAVRAAAAKVPLLWTPNMSLGVNLLFAMVEKAAAVLDQDYDAEIVEVHHRHKKDAPSGTALRLGEKIAAGRGQSFREVASFGREGLVGERPRGEIGLHAVRAGDVVGDHTVSFAADGERLEFTHRATSRDAFALGALKAARWLVGRPPGFYDMRAVLGL